MHPKELHPGTACTVAWADANLSADAVRLRQLMLLLARPQGEGAESHALFATACGGGR